MEVKNNVRIFRSNNRILVVAVHHKVYRSKLFSWELRKLGTKRPSSSPDN